LASHPELRWRVAQKLALDWSPEQISGWLKRAFPGDEGLRVSHETIYRSLFVQARGVLKKELMGHLWARRRMRYPKGGTTPSRLPGQIVDAISIRQRPAEIEDRAVPGHWEGDLLSGANNSHMATLVERHSRFAMLIKLRGKDTAHGGPPGVRIWLEAQGNPHTRDTHEVRVSAEPRGVTEVDGALMRALLRSRGLG
jgi:IS30 family transposase